MADGLRLSHNLAMILQTIAADHRYAYTIVSTTGLPSGSIYPALRRLEEDGLVHSEWEAQPPRKAYQLTHDGEVALETCRKRYPLLARLAGVQK